MFSITTPDSNALRVPDDLLDTPPAAATPHAEGVNTRSLR
jgi:hypothetical protein